MEVNMMQLVQDVGLVKGRLDRAEEDIKKLMELLSKGIDDVSKKVDKVIWFMLATTIGALTSLCISLLLGFLKFK